MQYQCQILGYGNIDSPHGSIARGVNAAGVVVGNISDSPKTTTACIWLPATPLAPLVLPYFPNQLSDRVGFNKIAGNSNAAGNYKFIANGLTHVVNLQNALGTDQFIVTDINNSRRITGYLPAPPNNGLAFVSAQGFIYDYNSKVQTKIPPSSFQGVQMTCPFGINASGKVVGFSSGTKPDADFAFFGFLYSGGTRHELGKYLLYDINDHELAVGLVPGAGDNLFSVTAPLPSGYPDDGKPILMDCSNIVSTPQPTAQTIPLPPSHPNGVATAVNNMGVVVGVCWGSSYTAFVYRIGQTGAATDLNTLLVPAQPNVTLVAAWDINDAGQIVGAAHETQGSLTKGFILTPV